MVFLNITDEQFEIILASLIDTYNDCIADHFSDDSYRQGFDIQNLLIQQFNQPIFSFDFFEDFKK